MHCCLGRGQIFPSPGRAFVKAGINFLAYGLLVESLQKKGISYFTFPTALWSRHRCKAISEHTEAGMSVKQLVESSSSDVFFVSGKFSLCCKTSSKGKIVTRPSWWFSVCDRPLSGATVPWLFAIFLPLIQRGCWTSPEFAEQGTQVTGGEPSFCAATAQGLMYSGKPPWVSVDVTEPECAPSAAEFSPAPGWWS